MAAGKIRNMNDLRMLEQQGMFRGMVVVLGILYFAILMIIYDYTRKLERTGCECAIDWRRTFISWYVLIVGSIVLIQVLVAGFMGLDALPSFLAHGLVPIILFILTVIFVVASLQYVQRLKVEKCRCSEGAGRTVLQVVSWYYVIMWVLHLIVLLNIISLAFILTSWRHRK